MNKRARHFLDSLRAQLTNKASLIEYMASETYLNGKRFSFDGHAYQEYIINLIQDNPGLRLVVKKCSQLGISEIAYRFVLSKMAVRPGTSVLLAMPSKIFSQEVLKTRVSAIISESPSLSFLIDNNVDSASVKMFRNNSILYALSGSKSSNSSLLNRPIAICLNDEVDKMDPDIISGFRSRQTHTAPEERINWEISTPTVKSVGIDASFDETRLQHIPHIVCNHCFHDFEPDYYKHVRIPGYDDSLHNLTKSKASQLNIAGSYLECPECLSNIDQPSTLWNVIENEYGMPGSIGVALDPFVAYDFISIPDLVMSSLSYTSKVEWLNQGLGKVADLRDSTILRENIHVEHSDLVQGQYVLGIDVGKMCHLAVGVLRHDTSVHVTELHTVKLIELEEFLKNLTQRIRFTAMVIDSMPAADLVYRLIKTYQRLFSAIYVDPAAPMPELYKLKIIDKYNEETRQITINKNMSMDLFVNSLDHFVTFEPNALNNLMTDHLLDMRRVRDYEREEVRYKWVKSAKGDDHFFHTLVYMFMASKLAGANLSNDTVIPVTIMKMSPVPQKR